jgi:aspartyl-tRNA(Asn)/glutamyl-tRNA(Gln) amidotransferase subunit A
VYGLSAYYLIAPAEASSNLARYDGVRYGLRRGGGAGGDITEMYVQTRSAGFGAEVKRRIMLGTYALSAGYYDAYYGKAQQVRTLIIRDFEAAYERFDVLLAPTAPTTAFALGAKTADPLTMYLNDVCTIPSNLAGHPAMSVPFGAGDDGLPVGVQVLAPALGETVMFQVAAVLEAAAPTLPPPPIARTGGPK